MPINRVKEAIEEIRKGNMVVMMDDEDRENEGDLVYASIFSTPKKVNFMVSEAKGLVCVSITKSDAERLHLKPMVDKNSSSHETAFTVSVDAKGCTTGISAYERDDTIKLLADANSSADDLVRPGHIFPLIAKDGGVLERTGHTEGSVDICKLAGVYPSGVICEILKPDGTMARRDDLELFAKKHSLRIVFVSDIVEYRLKKELLIRVASKKEAEFFGESTVETVYEDHHGCTHHAFVFGEIGSKANVKFHNITSDLQLIREHGKLQNLLNSVEYLKKNSGVLIFLSTGAAQKNDIKEYGVGAQILLELGVKEIRLLTSSQVHDFVGLAGFGLEILEGVTV